jgi:hypothetical protein
MCSAVYLWSHHITEAPAVLIERRQAKIRQLQHCLITAAYKTALLTTGHLGATAH